MAVKYLHIGDHAIYLHYEGQTTLPEVMPDFSRGRKIVFIHGSGNNGHVFHKEFRILAKSHSPLAPDLPGHGRSSGVEGMGSIRDYSEFLARLLDKLNLKSAVVAGHSMGGAIAMDFALRYPNRAEALVLMSSAAKIDVTPDRLEAMRAVMMGRAPQPFTTDAYSPKTVKEHFEIVREGWMEQVKTDPRVRFTDIVACSRYDLRDEIAKIARPVLLLTGADDTMTTAAQAQAIAAKIKGAKVEIIPDAGHSMPLEQAEAVSAAINSFLAQNPVSQ